MSVLGQGSRAGPLAETEVADIVTQAAEAIAPDRKRILVLIPDHTRTCPLPLVARQLHKTLAPRAASLDFLIALGTHPPLSDEQIDSLLGTPPGRRREVLPGTRVFNHDWKDPDALTIIGRLSADRIGEISAGRFEMDVDVTVNRMIFDYDLVLVAGPVFPHEVAGFSGGCKYLFPGICGQELLNFFHWLGAVITIPKIIGIKDTAVRATLDAAMEMVSVETRALCMVVKGRELNGLYYGPVDEAWTAAVDLSAKIHVVYAGRAYESILSQAPRMYDDLWVGAKCMYKMECVVADGGELVIYAPHIRELSVTHGKIIEQVGYHTLGFFLDQWDTYKHYPWGVLAHSTHVRGIGAYEDGVESPRVNVTLATGIPQATCERIGLGYRDPAGINPADWQGRQDEDRLYVPEAGEMLYRLKDPPEWAKV